MLFCDLPYGLIDRVHVCRQCQRGGQRLVWDPIHGSMKQGYVHVHIKGCVEPREA